MRKTFFQKLENLPIAIIPTMIGACTLSTIYSNLGFTWIKHISMFATALIFIAYIIKIFMHNETVLNEYGTTVPASLYAGITMVAMILGSYIFDFNAFIGKAIWFTAVILHAVHIIIFTYKNVARGINIDTFVPSWFVTYNGIMVSTVVGTDMNEPILCKIIVYYGICIFLLITPFMIYRLAKHPIKDAMYHTQAIVVAPSSLCVVSYINFIKEPNIILLSILYGAVIIALIFIIYKVPRFFAFDFHPGFAGLTFPLAIAIVASTKMSSFVTSLGYETLGYILKQISGLQIYAATAVIGFVLYNFARMFVRSYKNN